MSQFTASRWLWRLHSVGGYHVITKSKYRDEAAVVTLSPTLRNCRSLVYPFIEMVVSDEAVALTSPKREKYDMPV